MSPDKNIASDSYDALLQINQQLRERLDEAEETLRAISSGEVDALVASGPEGERIYTLKGADEAYRLMVQDMAEGALTLTREGLILFANEQFASIVGIPLEEIIGARLQDFLVSGSVEVLCTLLHRTLSGNQKAELSLEKRAGAVLPIYVSLNRSEHEGTGYICAVVTDLSEQRRNQQLLASEKLSRCILEQAAEVILVCDQKGKLIRASNSAEILAGTAVLFQNFDDLFPMKDFPFRKIFALTGRSDLRGVETGFMRTDSTWVETLLSAAQLTIGDSQDVVGCIITLTDITRRKRVEEALRQQEARFRFLTESMPQKIFTAKPNGDVDYFNSEWIQFTGSSLEHIGKRGWSHFVHPDDLDASLTTWKDSIATGQNFRMVHRFRRADGAYRWHLSRAQAMRDERGKVSLWIGSNTDIHEQIETEHELQRANEDLNQFAFAASHDLQEPLRMVTAYSQLLVTAPREQREAQASVYVSFITEGTRRMRELLADLLAYTQIHTDKQHPLDPVDLNVIFREVALTLRMAIEESGAIVTSSRLPFVRGYSAHLVQLFQNLIGNAIKYRGSRPPRIHVSAEQKEGVWRLAVADNGIGIDAEHHEKIFGVFKRLHGHRIPGTGIGLAICQRVVEHYGGRIWVESRLGEGATFYFTLPA